MAEEPEKGTKQNPLTREDVLRLIEENGGNAIQLDLSGKVFQEGIDLSGLDISGINLTNVNLFRANFDGTNLNHAILVNTYLGFATFNPLTTQAATLEGTQFRRAQLHNAQFRDADLTATYWGDVLGNNCALLENVDFRDANLFLADFTNCYFYGTKLEGAYIRGANLTGVHLEQADWGSYIIGEEERKSELHFAEQKYRQLKQWYANAGMYDIAGKFYFREATVRRKMSSWWPNPLPRFLSKLISLFCGYGERPLRVIGWAASIVAGLALVYFLIGSVWEWAAFWRSLYFSAVSFTALGYGSWFDSTNTTDLIRGLGAAESFIGVFSMALFLVTFTRKMTR